MSLEAWQAVPAVDKSELRPIVSALADHLLAEKVAADLGLSEADSLFSLLDAQSRAFQTGRLVVVNSLRPEAIQSRVETAPGEEACARWFNAANFVLRLTRQQSQGCYGGWQDGFALKVFGQ